MKRYAVVAGISAVLFAAFTAWPIWTDGYFGFVKVHTEHPWGYQVLADLVIALTLFMFWMVRDARRHSLPAWPFVIAIFATGSIGALTYIAVRGWRAAKSSSSEPSAERPAFTGNATAPADA